MMECDKESDSSREEKVILRLLKKKKQLFDVKF